ncbi:DNA polymerase delta subunit 4 [Rhynchospora pubera]|uniref:DNA polymerase delta subunit 4 n=1 Tax=Rhynchospora pubera TaxID=906938 RepID=A0AAV8CQC7_9POAL|nr:DNA polymerase delta subunit 4 [Rhynchospora pubera]KAJ4798634.1 DNA polymerase delta subunit 4 [Rhynchospora pubera]
MSSSNITSFFRQEKKTTKRKNDGGGVAIAKLCSKIRSDLAPLLVSSTDQLRSTKESTKEAEERLKEFDIDMRYGPSMGLTRIERWDRASALGLCPPADVESLLLATSTISHCLWQGRV